MLRQSAGVVSVSPAYPRDLAARYPWFRRHRGRAPVRGSRADFEMLRRTPVANLSSTPMMGTSTGSTSAGPDTTWTSRSPPSSRPSPTAPTGPERSRSSGSTLSGPRTPTGTPGNRRSPRWPSGWRGRPREELPRRIPYFEALQCLVDADALLVPGSDDPGYTASKLYPYILAVKPLLAVFHEASTVLDVLRRTGAGTVVSFAMEAWWTRSPTAIRAAWFEPDAWSSPPATDWDAFEPYTAER